MKKKILTVFLFLLIILNLVQIPNAHAAVTWTNRTTGTSAANKNWVSVAASSDGTKLVAVTNPGDIWTSSDSGVTWTNRTTGTGITNQSWASVTSSSDGTKLAVANNSNIYTSSDSGVTWTRQNSASGGSWVSITSSSDGTKLSATNTGLDIWTSSDSGVTWTNRTTGTSLSPKYWMSSVLTSDGTSMAAVVYGGDIYTSSNSGVSWTNRTTGTSAANKNWYWIASSVDLTKLVAVTWPGDIWTSSDSGVTWTNRTTGTDATSKNWFSVSSSADGTILTAVANGGDIWRSTDSGVTWTNITTGTSASSKNWYSVTTSSDGLKITAVVKAGDIWTTTIVPDSTAPSVALTYPTTGSFASSTMTLTATATDDTAVTGVQFKLDTNTNIGSEDTSSPYSVSWNSTGVADGSHTLSAVARDAAGNYATSTVTVTVDNTAPVISEVAPIDTTLDTTPDYTFTTNDAGTIVYGGSCSSPTTSALSGSNTITLNILALGTYSSCTVRVMDVAGNLSNTLTMTTFTIRGPAKNSNSRNIANIVFYTNPPVVVMPVIGPSITSTTTLVAATSTPIINLIPPVQTKYIFEKTLSPQSRDQSVKQLQIFLNTHGFPVALSGQGSSGQEVSYFGPATRAALINFQKANNISPAIGFFGPKTMKVVNGF